MQCAPCSDVVWRQVLSRCPYCDPFAPITAQTECIDRLLREPTAAAYAFVTRVLLNLHLLVGGLTSVTGGIMPPQLSSDRHSDGADEWVAVVDTQDADALEKDKSLAKPRHAALSDSAIAAFDRLMARTVPEYDTLMFSEAVGATTSAAVVAAASAYTYKHDMHHFRAVQHLYDTERRRRSRVLAHAPVTTRDEHGRLHSFDDVPAEVYPSGTLAWYRHGLRWRGGGKPALVHPALYVWYYDDGLGPDACPPTAVPVLPPVAMKKIELARVSMPLPDGTGMPGDCLRWNLASVTRTCMDKDAGRHCGVLRRDGGHAGLRGPLPLHRGDGLPASWGRWAATWAVHTKPAESPTLGASTITMSHRDGRCELGLWFNVAGAVVCREGTLATVGITYLDRDAPAVEAKQWTCPGCAFDNDVGGHGAAVCALCGAHRPAPRPGPLACRVSYDFRYRFCGLPVRFSVLDVHGTGVGASTTNGVVRDGGHDHLTTDDEPAFKPEDVLPPRDVDPVGRLAHPFVCGTAVSRTVDCILPL